ncbi:uncharacterized protein K452DRAFT_31825 [Aplosporella prunicola CBS 121167]|uniref:Secreted protein n=1 Tax=Aplosporella prunicola CBS 121167 TaxID=1176127 RepID=A0A6A6BDT7_9PEZI|nr:uncharacterized protein K452DRAFT_31825 [Aplosporella prunicola CBS 121167]KAF2141668.1 hypothetical protein K452DRAFT_31825 [Aplosporella prunicola CBS 121167]
MLRIRGFFRAFFLCYLEHGLAGLVHHARTLSKLATYVHTHMRTLTHIPDQGRPPAPSYRSAHDRPMTTDQTRPDLLSHRSRFPL